MQKMLFILCSAICLSAFTPTISYANNGPKIKLGKKKIESSKKTVFKKQNTQLSLSKTNSKLVALTKDLPFKPTAKEIVKKDIERKDKLVIKESLEEYEKLEDNRSMLNNFTTLQAKYASRLNIVVDSEKLLSDLTLLKEIDFWYGTPYRMGGTTKRGVDCSAFSKAVVNEVYKLDLPRTAREQYESVDKISRKDLVQGDLVFFNTSGGVSHVGIYLGNNKFIHSSSSKGVTISDLDETYWANRYIGAGKLF